jgi:hypothetical protein
LPDLQDRFETVLRALEQTEGWVTSRVRPQVLILGRLDGIETGVRQLIRRKPLETEEVVVGTRRVRVPTIEEILRVKAWLVLRRNATRDYLDVVALAERLGVPRAVHVLLGIDEYYEDQIAAGGTRVSAQLAKQLAEPKPYDLAEMDLKHYRELNPQWQQWTNVAQSARALASGMLESIAGDG